MAHGDNRGLKLPPKVAPIQAVIVPVAMHKDGVKEKAMELYEILNEKYRMEIDVRDNYTPGYKFNDWEMRGVPVRIELGPRDIENNSCVVVRRDNSEKITVLFDELNNKLQEILDDIQKNMYETCKIIRENRTNTAMNLEEFSEKINKNQGYIKTMWCGDIVCEDKIKELTGAHSRCIPFEEEHISDKCVCCGKTAKHMVVWGRQY